MLARAYKHHMAASQLNGLRCGVIRLIHVIAALCLGAGVFELAILALANACGLMLSYILGRFVSLNSTRRFLLLPAVASNLILVGMIATQSLQAFVVLASMHLLLDACTLPAMGTIQRSLYQRDQRGEIMGKLRSVFMACGLIVALLVSELLHQVPQVHHVLLAVAGLLGLLSCYHYWQMASAVCLPSRVCRQKAAIYDNPFHNSIYMFFLVFVSMAEIAHLMLQPLLPMYLMNLGVGARGLSWFFVIIPGICGVLSFAMWGRFIDRWGSLRVRAIGAALYAFEPILLIMAVPFGSLITVDVWVIIMLAAWVRGLGLGAVVLTWSVAPLNFSQQASCAHYVGCNNIITGLRACMAPLLAGFLFMQCSMTFVLLLSSGLLIIAAIALFVLDGQHQSSHDATQRQDQLIPA